MKNQKLPAAILAVFAASFLSAGPALSEEAAKTSKWTEAWKMVNVGTLWYLAYQWGEEDGGSYNREHIGRGYVNLKFRPTDWFQPRVTLDAHQDDTGDFKVRLKYMYGKFIVPIETAIITEPNIEFGLVHGPWFDYEEHVNWYRMQGTMFIERNGTLNSADLGFTVAALLGEKLPKSYQERVNNKYPGTWGSLAFGMYNGGGYHAAENNQNKVFESRISVRPLGPMLPNLTLSHFFIFGKGNTAAEPDWLLNAFMMSFEHQFFTATAQLATGEGNQKGDQIDSAGKSLEAFGYSGFLELKAPCLKSSLIGRYDHWEWGDVAETRIIAGYAFHFLKNNFVLLNLDYVMHEDDTLPDDWQVSLILQVKYPPK